MIRCRLAALLRRRPVSVGDDEATAAVKLGYAVRADHPSRRPWAVNHARPTVEEPEGSCGQTGAFEGVHNDTC